MNGDASARASLRKKKNCAALLRKEATEECVYTRK